MNLKTMVHPFKKMYLVRDGAVQEVAVYTGLAESEISRHTKAGTLYNDKLDSELACNKQHGGIYYKTNRR